MCRFRWLLRMPCADSDAKGASLVGGGWLIPVMESDVTALGRVCWVGEKGCAIV